VALTLNVEPWIRYTPLRPTTPPSTDPLIIIWMVYRTPGLLLTNPVPPVGAVMIPSISISNSDPTLASPDWMVSAGLIAVAIVWVVMLTFVWETIDRSRAESSPTALRPGPGRRSKNDARSRRRGGLVVQRQAALLI
jgi:hypothetical protein